MAACGRNRPHPGPWRNVARRSLVTKNSLTRASRAPGSSPASAGTNISRSRAAGTSTYGSAADSEIARYWPRLLAPKPEIPVRSNTHWTGESTAAANGSCVTRWS